MRPGSWRRNSGVRLELFDYPLPEERIAQEPLLRRDSSRLLHLDSTGDTRHRLFQDLPDLLSPGDLLIFNDTRVLPARLTGLKESGGARCELLLLSRSGEDRWMALVHPGRRLRVGASVRIGEHLLATIMGLGDEGGRLVEFSLSPGAPWHTTGEAIHALGEMPLPPYIHQKLEDPERYQTLHAREEGSAAAPTAGLHFTPEIHARLRERGVDSAFVTLHVGLATFRPVKVEEIDQHRMHSEVYSVPGATVRAIRECSGRVIAVGTTVVRCLESAAVAPRTVRGGPAETRLFIRPGYRFQVVDAMVTNFHMPRSTLVVMVSAFVGRERILGAYAEAVEEQYRFLSFGDATFLEPARQG